MNKLKDFRLRKGITQEQLAKQLGVGQNAISQYELGITMPRGNKLKKLAKIFNCTIDELLS